MAADRPSRRGGAQAGAQGGRDEPPAREGGTRDAETVHVRDPRDIRALAHPARMAIIDALASGDELTATECAALTGLSPSATAYHLKLLERYGFAEPAPARNDGRERPWRATDRRKRFELDTSTPASAAATTAVGIALIDRSRALAETFVATAYEEPKDWRDAASLRNADLWLTADETREVTVALAAVLEPYHGRTIANRPAGTRRVRIMNMIFPHHKR